MQLLKVLDQEKQLKRENVNKLVFSKIIKKIEFLIHTTEYAKNSQVSKRRSKSRSKSNSKARTPKV
jgi:hypothetical protein